MTQWYFAEEPRELEFDSERRVHHRGDGSIERYESRAEYEERRRAHNKQRHYEQQRVAHLRDRAFERFRALFEPRASE
jgi:hypothetical protein